MNETSSPPDVFVVLPAYNERAGIVDLLDGLAEAMQEAGLPYRAVATGCWPLLRLPVKKTPW